ncbi:hypothetical protein [Methanopyrus kandleri]|uniref:hypothetical protein n=1 Tax=Methanopyrus kandleri TaxID=2320 RepID=UPI001305377C|nr:hypothetical protein [Methanopyrus kandleri]
MPTTLQAEIERPTNYRLNGKQVSFWVPAPDVKYEVRSMVKANGQLSFQHVQGVSERQGIVTVELQGDPEFVGVLLRQPPRVAYGVRDRVRLSLRGRGPAARGVKVSWRADGERTRIELSGSGRVLLGLILDGGAMDVRVDGGSVLETGPCRAGGVTRSWTWVS